MVSDKEPDTFKIVEDAEDTVPVVECPLGGGKQHWEFENTSIDAISDIVDDNTYPPELRMPEDLHFLLLE